MHIAPIHTGASPMRLLALGTLVALAAVAAVVAFRTDPSRAAAHEHCFTDPADDVLNGDWDPVETPRADILEVCATYEPDELTFSMRVADPTDPDTDPAWEGDTIAIWSFPAEASARDWADGQMAFRVVEDELRATATWFDPGTPACEGTPSFDGDWYIASFDPGCLDLPATISYSAAFYYDTNPAEFDEVALHFDVAPDGEGREGMGRYAGPVTRSDATPPSDRLAGRLSGPTRIDTAAAISRSEFPHGAEEVYLARADDFPDALAAGSLTRGPVLLVPDCGDLPQVVASEIERLDPVRVFALGGTAAVCDALLDQARDV